MFVIQLTCPRDSIVVHFALFAEDSGPSYGLVANMMLKQSVFEEFAKRLGAEIRKDPNLAQRWQWPQYYIEKETEQNGY